MDAQTLKGGLEAVKSNPICGFAIYADVFTNVDKNEGCRLQTRFYRRDEDMRPTLSYIVRRAIMEMEGLLETDMSSSLRGEVSDGYALGLAHAKRLYRETNPGSCRMLSQGFGCRCFLCRADELIEETRKDVQTANAQVPGSRPPCGPGDPETGEAAVEPAAAGH